MGGFPSRRNANVEEVDISTSNAYRYPPKSGCYFGSHFIMGGEKFETTQPEAYLFGENADLNFLGGRPTPFPYPAPQAHEPTKTLKSLVNIRKDSLRFVKAIHNMSPKKGDDENQDTGHDPKYNIEFTFDTDVKVAITIYYFATEEMTNNHAVYHPRDSSMNSETYHYKRGANQTFSQTTHIIDPSKFGEEEWQYNPDKEVIPVVVQCVVEDEQHIGHSHALFGYVEKFADNGYVLKPLKQKQVVDGLSYLLQEIYGIENKSRERAKLDDDLDDNGSECVICMCETRDTLILPCRHLCLCNMCADNLRYQANNCPICRAPFRALLQIRALRKKIRNLPSPQNDTSDENSLSQEGVPAGYEAVSLLEALNGPDQPATSPVPPNTLVNSSLSGTPDDDSNSSLKRKGRRSSGRSSSRRSQKSNKTERIQSTPDDVTDAPEIVMTVHISEPVKDNVANTTNIRESDDDNLVPVINTSADIGAVRDQMSVSASKNSMKVASNISLISGKSDEEKQTIDTHSDCTGIQIEECKNNGVEDGCVITSPSSVIVEARMEEERDQMDGGDKPSLCLLQSETEAKIQIKDQDRVSGSSYSSTCSAKGLLDTDVVNMPDIEQ